MFDLAVPNLCTGKFLIGAYENKRLQTLAVVARSHAALTIKHHARASKTLFRLESKTGPGSETKAEFKIGIEIEILIDTVMKPEVKSRNRS
ncbi:hypothetical protein EVAR_16038_1 [Eumeta japonica]|uniref:Uncharacterized protein n=1 Tax=Eumeta variegata TaxID=151549 RepID=A0A4C1VZX5_EUMVA|nr:hypothetical protein EVAR_16038_1 [Eumeta japonica]